MTTTAVVDTQTNEFSAEGHAPDARYRVVPVPRNPDVRREKYSGDDADPIAVKTSAEITAWESARRDRRVDALLDDLTFRVLQRWIAQLHTLTPTEARQQLRDIVRDEAAE